MKLQGIFIPIALAFDHNGDLYPVKIRHNLEKWNLTGVSGYVVSGGESVYLSAEEKIRVWEWAAEFSAPEKIRIAATGMPSVRETAELTNRAASLGYKAAFVGVPQAEAETQRIYFSAVADRSRIPILIDGVPPEGLSHPNILDTRIGRSSGSMAEDFAAGAAAVICEIANAVPYAAICIWEAHRSREYGAAGDWQNRLARGARLIERYGAAALKHAMDLNGYYGGPPRLPLTVLTPARRREVEEAFAGLRG